MSPGIFRDWKSRVIHHTTVRINSTSMIQGVQGSNTLIKTWSCIDELCGSRFTPLPCSQIFPVLPGPNPQEDDAKFREFSKKCEGCPSRAGRLSKTFPEVPITFRVSSGKPESRLSIPLGLGIFMGWLGMWDAPELLAVCAS